MNVSVLIWTHWKRGGVEMATRVYSSVELGYRVEVRSGTLYFSRVLFGSVVQGATCAVLPSADTLRLISGTLVYFGCPLGPTSVFSWSVCHENKALTLAVMLCCGVVA